MEGDHEIIGMPQASWICESLLGLLGESFFEDRQNWLMVGRCVKNSLGAKGLEIFKNFTHAKYSSETEQTWKTLSRSRHGLNSIKMMAERCNPDQFRAWQSDIATRAALGALGATAGITKIADIANFLYGYKYLYTGGTSWWAFENNVWQKMTNAASLRQKFSRELSALFENIYNEVMHASMEDPENLELKKMAKKAENIVVGLQDPAFKSKVQIECQETFLQTKFEDETDEDPYILAMPNGILDMHGYKKGEIFLRPAYPDDWVTLQTRASYYPDIYNWDHPDVKYYMEFMRKILPDRSTREFCLKHKGSCLMGLSKDKLIPLNIGETAHNGKTTIAKVDRQIFGTYSGKLPLGAIVGRTPEVNAVNPAIAATKGTRLQQLDEGNRQQELNASLFKLLGGNDEQWARKLFSNGGSFVPQYNVVMYGNSAPSTLNSAGDSGVTERIVLIPHTSRFTSNPPESPEEQERLHIYKADPHICSELYERRDAGLWIYVEYLGKYLTEGLQQPDAVLKKTKAYQYVNDPYKQFVDAKLEMTHNRIDYVPLREIYATFKAWFMDAFPGKRTENLENFAVELGKVINATPEGGDRRMHGVKVKSDIRRVDRTAM